MPKSRGSDLPQRQSPRAPLHLKMTACSEANALHRPAGDRSSPKLMEDRRSPRSGPLHETKRRGVKVADLETKLGKAQEELKKLRDQLASAEAAKYDAEEALHKAKKQIPALAQIAEEGKPPPPLYSAEKISSEHELMKGKEDSTSAQATTDVFEVEAPSDPLPKEREGNDDRSEVAAAKREETEARTDEDENKDAAANGDAEGCETLEGKKENKDVIEAQDAEESHEVIDLKAKLLEKEKEVEFLLEENVIFKRRAKEESDKIAAAGRAKEQELLEKLSSMEEELKESKAKAEHLGEQLGTAESAKAALEADLKRLKVQTDQWRKAAEAAAAALTNDGGMGGRKVAERCGSMDKHLGGGYGDWGSPLMVAGDMDDDVGIGGGRRKSGGIRMFGDLWKKKGQQKWK